MATMTKSASSTKVRPLGDKVLIKRDEAETQTESGIFLPESAKDRPKTGTITAVGDGTLNTETGERTPLSVKKGDKVIFSSYAGSEIKLGKDELLIMSESDILAIID
jgi:chaperonin GroES